MTIAIALLHTVSFLDRIEERKNGNGALSILSIIFSIFWARSGTLDFPSVSPSLRFSFFCSACDLVILSLSLSLFLYAFTREEEKEERKKERKKEKEKEKT